MHEAHVISGEGEVIHHTPDEAQLAHLDGIVLKAFRITEAWIGLYEPALTGLLRTYGTIDPWLSRRDRLQHRYFLIY